MVIFALFSCLGKTCCLVIIQAFNNVNIPSSFSNRWYLSTSMEFSGSGASSFCGILVHICLHHRVPLFRSGSSRDKNPVFLTKRAGKKRFQSGIDTEGVARGTIPKFYLFPPFCLFIKQIIFYKHVFRQFLDVIFCVPT